MKILKSLIAGLILLVGIGCSSQSSHNALYGVWGCERRLLSYGYNELVTITLQENMIFAFDSKMQLSEDDPLEQFTTYRKMGEYEIIGDTLLRLNYVGGTVKEYGYKVDGDELHLKNISNGSVTTYTRSEVATEIVVE